MYGRHRADSGVLGYLGQTGKDALEGADIVRATPEATSDSTDCKAAPDRRGEEQA